MNVDISTKHADLNDYLKDKIAEKIGKLDKYFEGVANAKVFISKERNRTSFEATISAGRMVLRTEVTGNEVIDLADAAEKKLSSQLSRHKSKLQKHYKDSAKVIDFAAVEEIPSETKVVRTKHYKIEEMTREEAATHMEMLSHDFYLFREAESRQAALIYRRKDGNYGLITTEGE